VSVLWMHSMQDLRKGNQERGLHRLRQAIRKMHVHESKIGLFPAIPEGEGLGLHPPVFRQSIPGTWGRSGRSCAALFCQ
jgi:hypothetical protein